MRNILFITWDGPQTSYMEGLFMPIFHEIKKQKPFWNFHVLQFTWGDAERTAITKRKAEKLGINYKAISILRKPIASLGSFISLFQGASQIEKYTRQHQIDVVIPRSTFPAYMVNQLKSFQGKIVFDADGMPIEERVDFAGLKRNSFLYKFLKTTETKMLKRADAVITRSQKAIDIHLKTIGEQNRNKFSVVYNGRDSKMFGVNKEVRQKYRAKLGINEELLFVYAGSLGSQYCFSEMIEIVSQPIKNHSAKFLILTGNVEYAETHIPEALKEHILLKKVKVEHVSNYLNAADVAFALREPSFSMQGVAPIKLGEYLLCGLPVIASKGIGDSETILQQFEACYLYDHNISLGNHLNSIPVFIKKVKFANKDDISEKALDYFSLEAAAISYNEAFKKLL